MPLLPLPIKDPRFRYRIDFITPIRPFPIIPLPEGMEFLPCPDEQEHQYMKDGILYMGKSGKPVVDFIEGVRYQ